MNLDNRYITLRNLEIQVERQTILTGRELYGQKGIVKVPPDSVVFVHEFLLTSEGSTKALVTYGNDKGIVHGFHKSDLDPFPAVYTQRQFKEEPKRGKLYKVVTQHGEVHPVFINANPSKIDKPIGEIRTEDTVFFLESKPWTSIYNHHNYDNNWQRWEGVQFRVIHKDYVGWISMEKWVYLEALVKPEEGELTP